MVTYPEKLTLEKMQEIYDSVKDIPMFPKCLCGKESQIFYFVEGNLIGGACKKHQIKVELDEQKI